MKNWYVLAVAILAGFLVGLAGGYYSTVRYLLDPARSALRTVALAEYETLASLQYKHADIDQAREALSGFLDFMRQVRALPDSDAALERPDTYLTYLRLASLEEAAGNGDAARDYLAKAQQAATSGGKVPSTEMLLRTLPEMDAFIP